MCITYDFFLSSVAIVRKESTYIIGNSIVDYLVVDGAVKIGQRGATLHCLKLIVSDIPQLFEKGWPVALGP